MVLFLLYLVEDVGVVDVVLNRVGDGVVSAGLSHLTVAFPVPGYPFAFDHALQDGPLVALLFQNPRPVLQVHLELSRSVIADLFCHHRSFLVFLHFLHVFVQELFLQKVSGGITHLLFPHQVLVLRFEEPITPVVAFVYQVVEFLVALLIVVSELGSEGAGLLKGVVGGGGEGGEEGRGPVGAQVVVVVFFLLLVLQ